MASKSTDKTILIVAGCSIAAFVVFKIFGKKASTSSSLGSGYYSEEPEVSGYVQPASTSSSSTLGSILSSLLSILSKSGVSASSGGQGGAKTGTSSSGTDKAGSSPSSDSTYTPTDPVMDSPAGPGSEGTLLDGLNGYFDDANEASQVNYALTSGATMEQTAEAVGTSPGEVVAATLGALGDETENEIDALTQDVQTEALPQSNEYIPLINEYNDQMITSDAADADSNAIGDVGGDSVEAGGDVGGDTSDDGAY
ncbi:MAG: hypothetical protein P4K78_10760 [Terracidiphilus sp.]|nr:hypothetical protein [Terracidiphilus sp.]